MPQHGLAFLLGKLAMQVNRRRGNARFLNGTVLGFLVMLGLIGLTTYLLFTVRSDLDLAKLDDTEAAAEIQAQTQSRVNAESQVASLQQQQAALQQQLDAARIARGVAEAATQRESLARTAAEQEGISQEMLKNEALQQAREEQQERIAAEAAAQTAMDAAEEAQQVASRDRLAKQRAERELASTRTELQREAERERALGHLFLRGIVTGLLTYTVDDLPEYAADGVEESLQLLTEDLASWTEEDFTVSRSGPQETPDFTIGWLRDAGGHQDTIVGESRRLLAPLGETNCLGDWVPYDGETVRRLLWHELGHAFGYGNSEDANNVMHSDLATKFAVDQEVELVMAPSITHVIPLCGEGTFTFVFQEPDIGQGYQFAVLKPGVTPEDDYFDEDNQYMECGSTPTLFTNECIVEDGAALLIYTQVAITRITGTITKHVELPEITMVWDPATFRYSEAELQKLRDLFN